MLPTRDDDLQECDCAPSEREKRTLWPGLLTRRAALSLGVLGVAAVGVAAAPRIPAAYAADYPSWPDVVAAKANEASKQAEITRIQALIAQLQSASAAAQQAAETAGNEFYEAQQQFFDADQKANALQAQADAQSKKAKDAASKAGRVAAQLYQNGGDNASLQLFLSGSAADADQLLAKLGAMDTVLGANRQAYDDAVAARDAAQALSNQAAAQRTERDRLQKAAEQKMAAAQQAASAAQAALDTQNKQQTVLQAQLAALHDTTTKTVAQYQAGVAAAAAAEAERKRQAEIARQQEAQRQQQQGGGGSSSGGGGGSGWVRPTNGWQSSGYGQRYVQCGVGFCASSFHEGVDLASPCGTPIRAACSGRITYAGPNGGYGNYVRIDHGDGTGSGYGHIYNGGIFVRYGQYVSAGQVIAGVGNTGNSLGCHLHFETYVNGRPVNPVPFMAERGVSV